MKYKVGDKVRVKQDAYGGFRIEESRGYEFEIECDGRDMTGNVYTEKGNKKSINYRENWLELVVNEESSIPRWVRWISNTGTGGTGKMDYESKFKKDWIFDTTNDKFPTTVCNWGKALTNMYIPNFIPATEEAYDAQNSKFSPQTEKLWEIGGIVEILPFHYKNELRGKKGVITRYDKNGAVHLTIDGKEEMIDAHFSQEPNRTKDCKYLGIIKEEKWIPQIGEWIYGEPNKDDYRNKSHIPLFILEELSPQDDNNWLRPTKGQSTGIEQRYCRKALPHEIPKLDQPIAPINTYGLKVGDALLEYVIKEWSAIPNNLSRCDKWGCNEESCASQDRKIGKFKLIEGQTAFFVSGTYDCWLRAEGFKEFMEKGVESKVFAEYPKLPKEVDVPEWTIGGWVRIIRNGYYKNVFYETGEIWKIVEDNLCGVSSMDVERNGKITRILFSGNHPECEWIGMTHPEESSTSINENQKRLFSKVDEFSIDYEILWGKQWKEELNKKKEFLPICELQSSQVITKKKKSLKLTII